MVRSFPLAALLLLTACEAQIQRPGTCQTPAPKVRRMTRSELDATLSASTGVEVKIGATLAAEDMQLGYFGHDTLQVSTLFADQLDSASTALARERAAAVQCGPGEADERVCAKRVLKDLAGLTWRRPLTNEEAEELAVLFDVGRMDEDFVTGLALPMQAIIEATGALYKTELGEPVALGNTVRLTPWEIASELSFLATGAPPDGPLRAAAANGQLEKKEVRVQHLKRLLDSPAGTRRMREFVEQWFGLTNMRAVQKNNEYFPKFATQLRDDVAASAYQLMETAVSSTKGNVSELLACWPWKSGSAGLAAADPASRAPGARRARAPCPGPG